MSNLVTVVLILVNTVVICGVLPLMFFLNNRKTSDMQLELLSVIASAKDQYIVSHENHVAALSSLLYEYIPKEIRKKVNKRKLIKTSKRKSSA